MKALTHANVDAYQAALQAKFRFTVRDKTAAAEMKVMAVALEVAGAFGVGGLPSGDTWLDQGAITLGFVVWMPQGLGPVERAVMLAHEAGHVRQFWETKGGQTSFSTGPGVGWLYLTQGEARVQLEVEAERGAVELVHALGGGAGDPDGFAAAMRTAYRCNAGDSQLARDLTDGYSASVAAGVLSTAVGKFSAAWWSAP